MKLYAYRATIELAAKSAATRELKRLYPEAQGYRNHEAASVELVESEEER